jgi:AcrR family transcriptional regulator
MARTPSQASHEAIITAFIKLMERQAIDDITTDAIARAAGASKSTLYKHWADKEALLVEVIARLIATQPVANSGDFRADAAQILRNMFVEDKRGPLGRIWPKIFAYTATHPEFCGAVHRGILEQAPKHTLVAILRAAVEAGELRRDLEIEFALDLLAGPMMHHRFLCGAVPETMAEKVVAAVWPFLPAPAPDAAEGGGPPRRERRLAARSPLRAAV